MLPDSPAEQSSRRPLALCRPVRRLPERWRGKGGLSSECVAGPVLSVRDRAQRGVIRREGTAGFPVSFCGLRKDSAA